ncbi:MAG: hypothetical protein LBV12_03485 [Puniceicoccales bacterium]|jgi:hypothetical protein|nr:hypothetical protein [Puniceicoccales bacterium]
MEIIIIWGLSFLATIAASIILYRWKAGVVFLIVGAIGLSCCALESLPGWWKRQKEYAFLTGTPLAEGPIQIDTNTPKADIPVNWKFLNEILEKDSQRKGGVGLLTEFKVSLTFELTNPAQHSRMAMPWTLSLVDSDDREFNQEYIPQEVTLGADEWGFGPLISTLVKNKEIQAIRIRDRQPQEPFSGTLKIYIGKECFFKSYTNMIFAMMAYSLFLGIILAIGALIGIRKRPWKKRVTHLAQNEPA